MFASLKKGNRNLITEQDTAKVEESLKTLIFSIATSLNAEDTKELRKEIDDMIEFEKKLEDVNFKMKENYYRLDL